MITLFSKSGFGLKRSIQLIVAIMILFAMNNIVKAQHEEMLVRIAEIEIYPQYIEDYKAILIEEAEASVRLEKGVIAIFPMFQKEIPTRVRILEIYKNNEAYQAHLKTAHFLKYKNTTLPMVKSLKLLDLEAMDTETIPLIFKKMSNDYSTKK